MKVSETLREDARGIGLCDEHYNAWDKGWSVIELIGYFLRNPNWCMKNRFPSYEAFKKYADTDEVRDMGVFVDSAVTTKVSLPVYVFLKCSVGMIANKVCKLYFRDGSKAKIIADSGSVVMVDIYDNSEVSIETRGSGKAIVNQHGDVRPIMKGENIKYRKK